MSTKSELSAKVAAANSILEFAVDSVSVDALNVAGANAKRDRLAYRRSMWQCRELAVLAHRQGMTQVDIAKNLGVARSSVIEWLESST